MSEKLKTYMDLVLNGEVLPDEIDDFVEAWHESGSTEDLNSFLGMTSQEYSFWVSNPEFIELLISARHRDQPILEAVNDNVKSINRLAARSDQPRKIAQLREWIKQQG